MIGCKDRAMDYGGGHNHAQTIVGYENAMDYVGGHNYCDATYAHDGCMWYF